MVVKLQIGFSLWQFFFRLCTRDARCFFATYMSCWPKMCRLQTCFKMKCRHVWWAHLRNGVGWCMASAWYIDKKKKIACLDTFLHPTIFNIFSIFESASPEQEKYVYIYCGRCATKEIKFCCESNYRKHPFNGISCSRLSFIWLQQFAYLSLHLC